MEPSKGAEAPKYRVCDLHCPDIFPILGVPTITPPLRETHHDDADANEISDEATLDQVIKMLEEADVSKL